MTGFHHSNSLRVDIFAGITLAIVVLPQAIAFATNLAGVPPEYGIYSAIWGVLLTALLNPSRAFLGGPNSTMAAVIGFTLLPLSPPFSDNYIGYMLVLILIAGLIQILFFLIKPVSRAFDLIPESVTNGVITGIGCFLIYKSFAAFAGLPVNTQIYWPFMIAWQTLLSVLEIGNMAAIQIGLITLATGIIVRMIPPLKIAYILIALVVGTGYSEFLIARHGLENILIEQVGRVSIPFISPSLPTFDRSSMPDIISLIPGAITLAFIGTFQTVTSMRYLDRRRGVFHKVTEGIKTDALVNCVMPFISALPTCGSYNRMYMLRSLGSKSKVSVVVSVGVLFTFSYFFIDVLKIIPIPSLAAIIMLVGLNMIEWKNFTIHWHSKIELLSFLTSFMTIHIFGLFGAVIAGSLVTLCHFIWRHSHPLITLEEHTITVHDILYYGSLPELERHINLVKQAGFSTVEINTSEISYIDNEAQRFLDMFVKTGGLIQK